MRPASDPVLLLFMAVLAGCTNDSHCEERGGHLSADEMAWFVHPEGQSLSFRMAGTDSVRTVIARAVVITSHPGSRSVEEKCQWSWDSGTQVIFTEGPMVTVDHYGKGVTENQNSARIEQFRFSDHTPQNGVDVGGTAHDGVYVLENGAGPFPRILYSRSEGLLSYDHQGQRWERVP